MQKKQVDYTPLPEYSKRQLIALGYDPEKYQQNLNKAIEDGGNKRFDAYKSYYNNLDLTASEPQKATNAFLLAQTNGLPVVKTVYNTADDFKSSFANSLTEFWTHVKEAGLGIERKTGILSEEELAKKTREVQQEKAFQMLRVSSNAQKDPFSLMPDGSINWHGIAAGFGGMLGGLVTFAPAVAVGGLVTIATGGSDIPVIAGLSAATLSGSAATGLTMALDGYGSGYEEGLQRGLSNDQASTYGALRASVYGTVGSIPGGVFTKRLFGAASAEITDRALQQLLDKGFSKETLASVMPEMQDGIKKLLGRRFAAMWSK